MSLERALFFLHIASACVCVLEVRLRPFEDGKGRGTSPATPKVAFGVPLASFTVLFLRAKIY